MASLTLDWIQLSAAVGALHGVLLTVVLAAQRNNRTANRLLAALVASFTIYLASGIYYATGMVRVWPYGFGVSHPMPWLFGPLVYLYAVAASDRSWRFTVRSLVHLAPAAIIALIGLPYYVMSGPEKVALFEHISTDGLPTRLLVTAPTMYVSGIGYSIATIAYLRRHRRRIEASYSNTARVNLRWLVRLSAAAALIWVMATLLNFTPFGPHLRDEHVTLAVALLVYAIGYAGLRQPEVFRYETSEFAVFKAPDAPPVAPTSDVARYERSGLRDDEASRLKTALVELMDRDRPWTDSELTLADLAGLLSTTPHKLSEVLNSEVGQTFYDFVNGYRVREVQRRIAAGEARSRKMLALAMDAGFASKSTFNQVFKKHTNQTPSEFESSALRMTQPAA